jgi:hypothetical protein
VGSGVIGGVATGALHVVGAAGRAEDGDGGGACSWRLQQLRQKLRSGRKS